MADDGAVGEDTMSIVLAAAITLVPIQAHTAAEIEDYLEAWRAELVLDDRYEVELGLELREFAERHMWFFHPQEEPKHTASTNKGMGGNVEQWRGLVAAYFPANQVDTALCIMSYESGGNPNAYNSRSGASGLMQVLKGWADNFGYSPDDLFDPAVNLSISAILYADGGWSHWSPWNRGACH